jgi:ribosomal protein S2
MVIDLKQIAEEIIEHLNSISDKEFEQELIEAGAKECFKTSIDQECKKCYMEDVCIRRFNKL